jgi:hypothetical protein
VKLAVIAASPSPSIPSVTLTTPELFTSSTDVSELAHLRVGMLVADFVVPSDWRMLATN